MPTWSDKLVGEVVRLLLEAFYDPQFPDSSHGFRKSGDATPLREIGNTWTGTTWFIEGDISDCFGSLDHDILLGILAEKIHDNRFLRLIRNMLKAGYLEDWDYRDTLSGVPQGGTVSPVLSNIYLDKLDKFVEQELIPQYTRGARRRLNPEYARVQSRIRRRGCVGTGRQPATCKDSCARFPVTTRWTPDTGASSTYRYADDHILGFIGPKAEAEEIKARLAAFLRETLGLELNQAKTLITHARTQRARFLGYDISVWHCNTRITGGRRAINGKIALKVPPRVVKAQCARYRRHGKPWPVPLQNLDDYDIVGTYGAEYRGVVNYYLLAHDVWRLGVLRWNALTSLLKTLAAKHRSTVTKMAARQRPRSRPVMDCGPASRPGSTEGKPDLVARFGGIPAEEPAGGHPRPRARPGTYPRKQLIKRLRKRECELCETGTTVAFTRSPASRNSESRDRASPRGPPSWRKCDARRSSSARHATSTSTQPPSRTRHKSLESSVR